jgi:hypothetical protein
MKRLGSKLTYANVISTLCLVLLVGGGTAYAAGEMLPKNSVGSKQIKKEAVTPAKLSKASKAALTGPAGSTGAAGATGATGLQGAKGETGPIGPSTVYAFTHVEETILGNATTGSPLTVATLGGLPPGSYAIQAKLVAGSESAAEDLTECTLAAGEDTDADADYLGHEQLGDSFRTVFPLQIVHTFTDTGDVTIACGHEEESFAFVEAIKITAIKVGSIAANSGV